MKILSLKKVMHCIPPAAGCRLPAIIVGILIVAVFLSAGSCAHPPANGEILISAAISLKNAFEEIGALYEKQTGVKVRFNLGASGLLQKQIEGGAPADVFASAGNKQMDELQARGFIDTETRHDFARNVLALIAPQGSKFQMHSFDDLVRPEITRIAIGNPTTVPAGEYAQEAFKYLKLWDKLQSRLVLAENARQVLDYVSRGEADAGVVYASDIAAVHGKAVLAVYAPKESHRPILYPIAAVKGTAKLGDARRFINLTLSRAGQSVLAKYGFINPR
jgi:molybdate transport system substrate-binding protein